MKKSKLATILFTLLPIAFIAPPVGSLFGIRILFIDVICWLGLVLLFNNSWKAQKLIVWLILLVTVTIISNLWGMIIVGYGFNLKNFTIIKYFVSYLGAIAIGVNLSSENILKNRFAAISLATLFIMSLLAMLSPKYGLILAKFYGQPNIASISGRLMFLDPNPNMVGQIATILTILSVIALGKSKVKVALAIVAGATIIFLTTSRLNLIVLLTFLICYFFIINKRDGSWKGPALVISAGLVMFSMFNSYANDKYFGERVSRITNMKSAVMGRFSVFESAFNYFIQSPIIGTGYKKNTQRGNKPFSYTFGGASELHSQWLGSLFNHGIIGFSILLGFCIAVGLKLRTVFKMYRNDTMRLHLLRILLALYICYFISMLGWETLYLPHYSLLFFIFFGKLYQLKYDKYPTIKTPRIKPQSHRTLSNAMGKVIY